MERNLENSGVTRFLESDVHNKSFYDHHSFSVTFFILGFRLFYSPGHKQPTNKSFFTVLSFSSPILVVPLYISF